MWCQGTPQLVPKSRHAKLPHNFRQEIFHVFRCRLYIGRCLLAKQAMGRITTSHYMMRSPRSAPPFIQSHVLAWQALGPRYIGCITSEGQEPRASNMHPNHPYIPPQINRKKCVHRIFSLCMCVCICIMTMLASMSLSMFMSVPVSVSVVVSLVLCLSMLVSVNMRVCMPMGIFVSTAKSRFIY